jgi:hypothetical protein
MWTSTGISEGKKGYWIRVRQCPNDPNGIKRLFYFLLHTSYSQVRRRRGTAGQFRGRKAAEAEILIYTRA